MDDKEMFNKMHDLLYNFVEEMREVVENDEPFPGTDAVDVLVDLYYRAKGAINGYSVDEQA